MRPEPLIETVIAAAARDAALTGRRAELRDPACRGLRLRITPGGERSWSLLMRDGAGRLRRFNLGEHAAIGLAVARKKAAALREDVRRGADPVAEKRARQAAAKAEAEGGNTLAALLDRYERQRGNTLRSWPEYRRRIGSVFGKHLATPLPKLALSDLQAAADDWPAPLSAAAACRYLRPILKWAAAPGRKYVARDLVELSPPAVVGRRQRVLSREELAAILPVLRARGDAYGAAFRFMLLTLARREEVCGMTWREVDGEARTWTLPPERTKSRRSNVIPLSRQAFALLEALRPEHAGPEVLVFKTATGRPLANWDRETRRSMRESGTGGWDEAAQKFLNPWTRHDLRRSAATMLGKMGVEPHVIEGALNHAHVGGQLASLYNQSRYLPEVAGGLQLLADRLDGIEQGGAEVIALRQ